MNGLPAWKLDRVTEHIEAHLSDTIKVHELAELSELSLPHFARLFRQLTGMPPHRWHLCARIRRAQALLVDTNLPLVEIALNVGFADQSHFTNVFRRQVGVSPGSWRHTPQGTEGSHSASRSHLLCAPERNNVAAHLMVEAGLQASARSMASV